MPNHLDALFDIWSLDELACRFDDCVAIKLPEIKEVTKNYAEADMNVNLCIMDVMAHPRSSHVFTHFSIISIQSCMHVWLYQSLFMD